MMPQNHKNVVKISCSSRLKNLLSQCLSVSPPPHASPFFLFFPFPLFLLVSRCSCRGGGQLWRGLSQSKDSDRGAIRALHLDPHPGEAVIALFLHDHPTPTPPSTPSTAKSASPACLSSSEVIALAITENDTERWDAHRDKHRKRHSLAENNTKKRLRDRYDHNDGQLSPNGTERKDTQYSTLWGWVLGPYSLVPFQCI